ncbi:hypothetical protein DPMN_058235 [Dreissena polymorpha]|uniref:Uncharacterized protein n=1 Tax=Dreissena polymorpha TaxID=45954 RepID=A0A9D4C1N0_DREPO|nr:hypothetical protein DPMN_058235 [Dreissena polymorpha]
MLTPRIMKLHRKIDHDWQMTPIDFQVTRYVDHDWQMTPINFQVTRSKVKVTQWLPLQLTAHMGGMHDQVRLEIVYTCKSVPLMAVPTVTLFTLEVRGYGKLYDNVDSYIGYVGILVSIVTFITFTDGCIYWIHRFLHHKLVYRHLHKDHHK